MPRRTVPFRTPYAHSLYFVFFMTFFVDFNSIGADGYSCGTLPSIGGAQVRISGAIEMEYSSKSKSNIIPLQQVIISD